MSDAVLPIIRMRAHTVSRHIVGGNSISDFSHQSDERSRQMIESFAVEVIPGMVGMFPLDCPDIVGANVQPAATLS